MKGIMNPVVSVVRFGKVPAELRIQFTQVLCYITFDIVRKLELICTPKNHTMMERPVCLSRTLNIVVPVILDSDLSGEKKTSPR